MTTYIQEFHISGWAGVKISGRLDAFNDKRIADQIRQLIAGHQQVVFDLEACDFMSLQMLKFMAELNRSLQSQGGQFALVNLNHHIRRQIEIFLGTKSFKVFQNMRDLANGFNRQPRAEFQNYSAEVLRSGL